MLLGGGGWHLSRCVDTDILDPKPMQTQRVPEGSVGLVIDVQCLHVFGAVEERRRLADLVYRYYEGKGRIISDTSRHSTRPYVQLHTPSRLLRPGGLALVVTGNAEEPPRVRAYTKVDFTIAIHQLLNRRSSHTHTHTHTHTHRHTHIHTHTHTHKGKTSSSGVCGDILMKCVRHSLKTVDTCSVQDRDK